MATLACDIAYSQNSDPFWFTATEWLLGVGVIMALLAALAGLTDVLGDARIRAITIVWWHFLGNLLVVLI